MNMGFGHSSKISLIPGWLYAWLLLIAAVGGYLTWKWYFGAPLPPQSTLTVVLDLPPTSELLAEEMLSDSAEVAPDTSEAVTSHEGKLVDLESFLQSEQTLSPEESLILKKKLGFALSDRDNFLLEQELIETAVARIQSQEEALN